MGVIIKLMVLLTCCQGFCWCQRGEFFEPGSVVINNPSNAASYTQTLNQFLFFGESYDTIRISFHGVVTIGKNGDAPIIPNCPFLFGDLSGLSDSLIAPFWLPNTNGEVHLRTFTKEDEAEFNVQHAGTNVKEIEQIAKDINAAYQSNEVTRENFVQAAVITWNKMKNRNQKIMKNRQNIFQLVLAIAGSSEATQQLYAIFVYKTIQYEGIRENLSADETCGRRALSGFNAKDINLNFWRSRTGSITIFTNEKDFAFLGRWSLKFSGAGSYPQHSQNCVDPTQYLDPFCTSDPGRSFSANFRYGDVQEVIHREFCDYRDAGIYPHPLYCDRFVYCGLLGSRADVRKCPEGLNFNEYLFVCDWQANVECTVPIERVQSNATSSKRFVPKTQQPILHNNTCLFRGDADVVDPLSCENYYSCTNTKAILRNCPVDAKSGEPLWFKPTSSSAGYCEYPKNVKCKNGIRPSPEEHEYTEKPLYSH